MQGFSKGEGSSTTFRTRVQIGGTVVRELGKGLVRERTPDAAGFVSGIDDAGKQLLKGMSSEV